MSDQPKRQATDRRELRRIWFVNNITLEGSQMVTFLGAATGVNMVKINNREAHIYFAGAVVTVEWEDLHGRQQVRVVPLHNVTCFEPMVD